MYLAIPYSKMDKNDSYRIANEATVKFLNEGYNVFSPITHSHPFHIYNVRGDWEFWEKIDYQFIDWCDEVRVIVPYGDKDLVRNSVGVMAEIKYAKEKGLPISYIEWDVNKINPVLNQPIIERTGI